MRSENKLSRSYLVLIKENEIEIRLSAKGKAKIVYHCFSMFYNFKLIFLPDKRISTMYFYLWLSLIVIIPWALICKLMPFKIFTCWEMT